MNLDVREVSYRPESSKLKVEKVKLSTIKEVE